MIERGRVVRRGRVVGRGQTVGRSGGRAVGRSGGRAVGRSSGSRDSCLRVKRFGSVGFCHGREAMIHWQMAILTGEGGLREGRCEREKL